MKKLSAIILLSLLMFSCSSSDSDTDSNTDNDNILIRKIISTSVSEFGTNTRIVNYTYNGRKLATSSGDDIMFQYYYTGNLITSIKDYFRGTLQATITLQYDTSNRLTRYTEYVYMPETRVNRQSEISYNADGSMVAEEYIFDNGEKIFTHAYTRHFFFNTDEEIERVETLFPNGTQVAQYAYDNKHNIFKNVIGFKEIKYLREGFHANVTAITYSGYDPGYNEASAMVKTYTYNADGFPTQGVRIYPNDTAILPQAEEYFYQ